MNSTVPSRPPRRALRPAITALALLLAMLSVVAHVVARTAPVGDALTVYCNKKRGSLDTAMVKKQCKCSLKRVINPAYDWDSCVNLVPTGVVPKFTSKLAVVYQKVQQIFATLYPPPVECQDEAGFGSTALTAATSTVIACCQSLASYLSCVQQGAF